jgi:hypothetical protein
MLRQSVVWPTLGNHDTNQSTSFTGVYPYFSIFTLPTKGEAGGLASGTEHYYSFDYGDIHFLCLDTMTADRSPAGAMLTWAKNDLAATAKRWIVAFFHHPPYTKGSHDSDSESQLTSVRQNILPVLEAGGVDLVLSGHSHSYERSYLLDGHYGLSSTLTTAMKKDAGGGRGTTPYSKLAGPHNGAVYAVAGSSGQVGGGTLNHPAMFISLAKLGSVVLDVTATRLDVRFLRETGAVDDSFAIVKSTPPPPVAGVIDARIASSNDDAEQNSSGVVNLTSTDLDMLTDGTTVQSAIGMRFQGLGIDPGATITKAYVQFACDELGSATTSLSIKGEAADNAAAFTTVTSNITARLRTTSSVAWAPAAWTVLDRAGTVERTPELKAVLQEIVRRPGWTKGNAIALIITGSGQRVARSFNGSAALAPLLHVEFSRATSLSVRVAASDNDAEENTTSGVVTTTSTDLDLIRDTDTAQTLQTVGIRFTGVTIPPGSQITAASVQFKVDEADSIAATLTIRGQAADNAGIFTATAFGVSSRPRTAASVAWAPPVWTSIGATGAEQRTPDLARILQEIVDRPGWANGNAISFIITGSGRRCAESFNGDAAGAPLLKVDFIPLATSSN